MKKQTQKQTLADRAAAAEIRNLKAELSEKDRSLKHLQAENTKLHERMKIAESNAEAADEPRVYLQNVVEVLVYALKDLQKSTGRR